MFVVPLRCHAMNMDGVKEVPRFLFENNFGFLKNFVLKYRPSVRLSHLLYTDIHNLLFGVRTCT